MVVRYLSDAELYHHGVKGQKWGVRHYQNPDGSLTAAGKKRLYKDLKSQYKKYKKSGSIHDKYDDEIKKKLRKAVDADAYKQFKKASTNEGKAEADLDKYPFRSEKQIAAERRYSTARAEYKAAASKAAKSAIGKYSNRPLTGILPTEKNRMETYVRDLLWDIDYDER